ncbi:hypothetical protein Lepto7376_2507 [[Leptolyngbya] sp. PCC 7376]|uniref:hypothetical protein n=1 Tax=[Leptolyngbya] sp. PCC 7376 TaxID=111781 RepID=UPI00029EDEEE|nr:hypothetical protein [[Leptolyngbya] sp. PCC 7376]AFY38781.1 hypothetical protein Lepto7376_2507 [[Leptolyngbya] sp. PCC 7376]
MQSLITYPQLLLFAYHQGDTSDWDEKRRQWGLPEAAEQADQNYFPFAPNNLEAFWQRQNIGDTKALMLGCSYRTYDGEKPISSFQEFREGIKTEGNIGKTWVLLSICSDRNHAIQEELAQDIYQSFTSSSVLPTFQSGKFFHANIFCQQDRAAQENIFILFFPDRVAIDQFPNYFYKWLYLLCYQHKIIWSYNQAHAIKKQLVNDNFFPKAEDFGNLENFESLKDDFIKNFSLVSQHNIAIESLRIQRQNIGINLKNYQNRLDKFLIEPAIELNFLQDFSDLTVEKFQTQLEEDDNNLSAGLRLRKEIIESLRGVVEVYNAESNQRQEAQNQAFQNWVGIIGVGTAFAATAVSVVTEYIEIPAAPEQDINVDTTGILIVGGISFGIGAIASLFTWLILRLNRR